MEGGTGRRKDVVVGRVRIVSGGVEAIKLGGQSKEKGKGFLCDVCRPVLQVHGRPAEARWLPPEREEPGLAG